MGTVKKHLNSKGKWVECGATKRACRYSAAGSHKDFPVAPAFSNAEEVFEHVNSSAQSSESLENVVENDEDGSRTYTFSSSNIQEAVRRLERANARLARAGLDGRYTWDEVERVEVNEDDGNEYTVVDFTVHRPEIINNGWTFVGRIDSHQDPETGGTYYITKSIGSHEIGEAQAERGNVCDQCGQNRDRHKTYIVKNDAGEVKKVGSSCLKDFLTIRPSGLWALESNPLDAASFNNSTGRYSVQDMVVRPREVIAVALAVSQGGEHYISNAASANTDRVSTRMLVSNYMFSRTSRELRNEVSYEPYLSKADEIISSTVFEGDNDYSRNMRNLLSRERVPASSLGYLVSSVGAYRRQNNLNRRPAFREKARGFLAEVGEPIPNSIEAHVEVVRSIPGYAYYSPEGKMIVMRTNDNKVIKWTTSSQSEDILSLKKGTVVNLEKGKVKAHDNFNDEDQTVIKNAKLHITSRSLEEEKNN